MFAKSKSTKSCRTTPVSLESKLKPLPNIGIGLSSKAASTSPANRFRHSGTAKKPASRSSDSVRKSSSLKERKTPPFRAAKVLNAVNVRSRESPKYKSFGKTSDPYFEDPSRRHVLPDPYSELKSNLDSALPLDPNAPWWLFMAEMKLQARRQAINLDTKLGPLECNLDVVGVQAKLDGHKTKRQEIKLDSIDELSIKQNANQEDEATCKTDNNTGQQSANSPVKEQSQNIDDNEHTSKEHNSREDTNGTEDNIVDDEEDDEDEEEDESGLPQAVRALQPKQTTPNAREVVRERHKAMMEEIARAVTRKKMMPHLRVNGFFNYDYSQHARTTMTNHNLRKGKKKGIERLLTLLACKPTKCAGELYSVI